MLKRFQENKDEMWKIEYVHYILWLIALFIFTFLSLVAFFGEDALPPDGHLFHMFALFVLSHICGKITYCCNLPSLFGMLVAGFAYGNLMKPDLNIKLVSTIRSLALSIILARAGLHLSPEYMKSLSFACLRITVVPFMVETLVVGLCSYLFFQFDLIWSLMIGFVLAAVSPAVIVPCMIRIQNARLSVGKGIPTLNIAAASVDDALAVTGFNICLSFAYPHGETLAWSLLKGPIEVLISIVFGVSVGMLLWYIPERYDSCEDSKKYHLSRFSLLSMAAIFATFGSSYFNVEASGPLAIIIMSFVATIRWTQNGWQEDNEQTFKIVWLVFKRYIFCLIGVELRISDLDGPVVIKVLLALIIGLAFKILVAYLLTYGINLNRKERLFVAISWLPKATVQAAVGPVALSMAMTEEDVRRGRIILQAAAISIIMTAPLGATVIEFLCTKLLTKPNEATDLNNNRCPSNTDVINSSILNAKNINIDLDL